MNKNWKRLVLALIVLAMSLAGMAACTAPLATEQPGIEEETPVEDTSGSQLPEGHPMPLPGRPLPDKQPPNAQNSEADQLYSELVERYYALVSDPYGFVDIAEYGEFGVIESARAMEDNALDGLGYTIQDLSGDGIPELVVGTLPEYGGQINAVYTLVDGQPQFVFEGWYRSSYFYLGDGRFFYYGSSSASETCQGSFSLSRDGTTLNCEDFYFTHAAEEDYSDLKVYHNTTGSWDIAESQESDMSLEGFQAYEPSYEDLPLTSFADYAAERGPETPVQVHWAELWLHGITDYEEFVADDGEYATDVLFTAKRTITDFELMRLTIREIYDDGTVSYASEPIYSLDRLTPERPLVVRMTFPGDTPTCGISYVDKSGDGMTHHLTVEISGEDGTLQLQEIY